MKEGLLFASQDDLVSYLKALGQWFWDNGLTANATAMLAAADIVALAHFEYPPVLVDTRRRPREGDMPRPNWP